MDRGNDGEDPPKFITKEQFGRNLYRMMIGNGWRQSDLAHAANIPRTGISTYIRGEAFPNEEDLQKLSAALGVGADTMLPDRINSRISEDRTSLSLKVCDHDPNRAWINIDREVSLDVAVKIMTLLQADSANGM